MTVQGLIREMYGSKQLDLGDIIASASTKYGVDPDYIKATIKSESDFNPKAVSKAGAKGLMQLMDTTAGELGVKDPFDPEQNIMGGTKYLAQNLKKYGGDPLKASAAYNAGPGNVDKAIKQYGDKWLENLDKVTGHHAKETRQYLENISKHYNSNQQTGMIRSQASQDNPYFAGLTQIGAFGYTDPKNRQIQSLIRKMYGQKEQAPSPGYMKVVGKGLLRGAEGLAGGIGSATRWLGEVTDAEKIARAGKVASDYWKRAQTEGLAAPDPTLYQGTFLEHPSFKRATGIVAEALPSLGAAVITSIATGSPLTGAGMLALVEGAPQYEEAKEAGKSVGEASYYGGLSTLGTAVLEYLPIGRMLKFKGGLIKGASKAAIEEGAQEATQTVWQNLIAKAGYDDTRGLAEGVVESLIGGVGTGGVVGGATAKYNQYVDRLKSAGVTDKEIKQAEADVKKQFQQAVAEKTPERQAEGLEKKDKMVRDIGAKKDITEPEARQEVTESIRLQKKQTAKEIRDELTAKETVPEEPEWVKAEKPTEAKPERKEEHARKIREDETKIPETGAATGPGEGISREDLQRAEEAGAKAGEQKLPQEEERAEPEIITVGGERLISQQGKWYNSQGKEVPYTQIKKRLEKIEAAKERKEKAEPLAEPVKPEKVEGVKPGEVVKGKKPTKREKAFTEYNTFVANLTPEQRKQLGDLVVENPKSPSSQLFKIQGALKKGGKKEVVKAPQPTDWRATYKQVGKVPNDRLDEIIVTAKNPKTGKRQRQITWAAHDEKNLIEWLKSRGVESPEILKKPEAEVKLEAQEVAAKEPWELTKSEWLAKDHVISHSGKDSYYHRSENKKDRVLWAGTRSKKTIIPKQHIYEIRRAINEGKPVPRHILEDYKGEPWADEALAPSEPAPTKPSQPKPAIVPESGVLEGGKGKVRGEEAKTPKIEKQPWEMTNEEWVDYNYDELRELSSNLKSVNADIDGLRKRFDEKTQRHHSEHYTRSRDGKLKKGVKHQEAEKAYKKEVEFYFKEKARLQKFYDKYNDRLVELASHKDQVQKAISEGKPVPAEVLKDYPDLAEKYGKKAELKPEPKETKKPEPKKAKEEGETLIPISPDDLDYKLAERAHSGTSWTPDERAKTEQQDYVNDIKSVHDQFIDKITEDQKPILIDELNRYKEQNLKKRREVLSARSRVMSAMIAGPAKFPAARNEKRARTYEKRSKEFVEWREKAIRSIGRKLGIGKSKAISSDDTDAVAKLKDKLDKLQEQQDFMKKVNAAYRKYKKNPKSIESLPDKIQSTVKIFKPAGLKDVPFESFELRNNNANIRRIKQRIEALAKKAKDKTTEIKFDGGTIVDSVEDNRVQIFFDDKPSEEIRTELKQRGFKWAKSIGAWQRMRSSQAMYYARKITGTEEGKKDTIQFSIKDEPLAQAPQPKHHQNIKRLAKRFNANFPNAPKITVLKDKSELPDFAIRGLQRMGKDPDQIRVRGFHSQGKLWLVASDLIDETEALSTALHETVGHYGVRQILGEEFDGTMLEIYESKQAEIDEIAKQRNFDVATNKGKIKAADEWLAQEAGRNPQSSWVQRVKAMIIRALRKAFPNIKFSDAEVVQLIAQSREYLRGEQGGVGFEFAQSAAYSVKEAAKKITDNPNFRKWFGDSKVVDENGEPLVVYHASDNKFNVFQSGNSAGTIYFGFTEKDAKRAARGKKYVIPVYLKIQNPYGKENPPHWGQAEDSLFVEKLKRQGYDGIYVKDEGGTSLAVFYPTQIKSIFNKGSFDPNKPDIQYSTKKKTSFKHLKDIGLRGRWGKGKDEKTFYLTGDIDPSYKDVLEPLGGEYWYRTSAKGGWREFTFKNAPEGIERQIIDALTGLLEKKLRAQTRVSQRNQKAQQEIIAKKAVKSVGRFVKDGVLNAGQFFKKTNIQLPTNDPNDVRKGIRWVQTMQDLARNYPKMKELFDVEIKRVSNTNQMSVYDRETTDAYFTLTPEAKKRVNQALIAGDIDGEVFDEETLKSRFKLSDSEIKGYESVREILDEKMDILIEQMLSDVVDEGESVTPEMVKAVKESKSFEELRAKLVHEGVDQRKAEWVNWIIDWVKERKGYVPHKWKSEWVVKATVPEGGEWMLEVPTVGGKVLPTKQARQKAANIAAVQVLKEKFGWDEGQIEKLIQKGDIRLIRTRDLPAELFQGARMDIVASIVESATNKAWAEYERGMTPEQLYQIKDLREKIKAHTEELYLAKGWGRHLIGRKGVMGYREDMENVLAEYLYGFNAFTSKGEAAREFAKVMKDINPTKTPVMWQHGREFVGDMLGATSEAGIFKKTAGLYFLAGDVSAATLNITQNWTHAVPMLRAIKPKEDKIAAEKEIYRAMRDVAKEYTTARKEGRKVFSTASDSISQGEINALKQAYDMGHLDPSFMGELTGFRPNKIWQSYGQKIWDGLFKMFTGAEAWNRTSTFLAAYRRGVRAGIENPIDKAVEVVKASHFVYGRGNRPQIVRKTGALGNIAFTFMTYPLNNLVFLKHRVQDILDAAHKGDKQAVKDGMRVAGSNLAYVFAFGGMLGLPFSWLGTMIWNLFNDDEDDWEVLMRKYLPKTAGRTITRGIPAALLGNDMSWRIEGTDVFGLPVGFQIATMAKKRAEKAHKLWGQGEYLGAVFHLTPDMIRNPYRAVVGFAEGGERAGVPPIKYTAYEALTKGLGFTPTRETETYKTGEVTRKARQFRLDNLENFAERYLIARKKKDKDAVIELREDLREYNQKQKKKGQKSLRISWKDVTKSAKTRRRSRGKSYREHVPKYMRRYQQGVETTFGL